MGCPFGGWALRASVLGTVDAEVRKIALAEPRTHGFERSCLFKTGHFVEVEATPADVVCHRALVRLDQGDAGLESGGVGVPAFGIGLAIPVRLDHPWTRRKRKPFLVGENTASAVADRTDWRLPLDASSAESDDDEELHWLAVQCVDGVPQLARIEPQKEK